MSRAQMYTAVVSYGGPGETEEIDVEARSTSEARKKVEAILKADYEPGWKKIRIDAFHGITITTFGGGR